MVKLDNIKIVCHNKRALQNYEVIERYEAGIVLKGTEVKSLRMGGADLKDSYGVIRGEEVFLLNAHISPYAYGNRYNLDPDRTRKLLLHKAEIKRLIGKVNERGFTLIPIKIYFKDGRAKVELALAKGKRTIDKRETLKRRTMEREMEKEVKSRRR